MVGSCDRKGRAAGGGFVDYPADGPKRLWPSTRELFAKDGHVIPLEDMKDRFMFVMALETAQCFEGGVIESAAAANIGSVFGIGFPPMHGGAVQFVLGYEGGLNGFVDRAREVASPYGRRFAPTDWLIAKAESGASF